MRKKYTIKEDTQMACEPSISQINEIGIADAIWTLIVNQTAEVQDIIAKRMRLLHKKPGVAKPYSMTEITARIDEAEQQIERGELVSGETVHKRMREYINSSIQCDVIPTTYPTE